MWSFTIYWNIVYNFVWWIFQYCLILFSFGCWLQYYTILSEILFDFVCSIVCCIVIYCTVPVGTEQVLQQFCYQKHGWTYPFMRRLCIQDWANWERRLCIAYYKRHCNLNYRTQRWEWRRWGRSVSVPCNLSQPTLHRNICVSHNQRRTNHCADAIWPKGRPLDPRRWSHSSLNFAQTQVTVYFHPAL